MNPENQKGLGRVMAAASAAGTFFLARAVHAQLTIDTQIGSTLGLGTAELQRSVINFTQFVLGLMGLIAVVMIIYGGILWTTAAGNENQVEKAKKVITSAAIGLVIVILSWAIVIFVVGTTSNVTQ